MDETLSLLEESSLPSVSRRLAGFLGLADLEREAPGLEGAAFLAFGFDV